MHRRRLSRLATRVLRRLLALTVIVALAAGLSSEIGLGLVARAIGAASGERVQIKGLSGALPFALRVEELRLADADGPWLRIERAVLELAPRALLDATLAVHSLSAGAVDLLRLPPAGGGEGGAWPLALQLDRLDIEQLRLTALGPGLPVLSMRGGAALSRMGQLELELAFGTHDGSGPRLAGTLHYASGQTLSSGELRLDSELALDDLGASGLQARLRLHAQGPIERLRLDTDGSVRLPQRAEDSELRLVAAGDLAPFDRRLQLHGLSLDLTHQGLAHGLRQRGTALVALDAGLAIEDLRLGLLAPTPAGPLGPSGELRLSGRLTPAFALDANVSELPVPVLLRWLPVPAHALDGLIGLELRLQGTPKAPLGTLDLQALGLRPTEGVARGLPAGDLRLALRIGEQATAVDARASAGAGSQLDLSGRIGGSPFTGLGPLAVRARGQVDLGLLTPLLAAGGRQLDGQLGLDLGIGGRLHAPRLDGVARLSQAAWRDRRLGLALTDIDGAIRLAGDHLEIERLSARADPGTLTLSGRLGWRAPDWPVDLRLSASDASPIELDWLRLRGDADLRLQGALARQAELGGALRFSRVDLRIPERLPVTVATLEVQEIGERRQPRRAARRAIWSSGADGPAALRLDLAISAPGSVTLRGRGIDAELGGEVRVGGDLGRPAIAGGFGLLRGDYTLAGQRLRFTRGRIGFDGASALDPTLDLEARVSTAGATAILAVQGTARAPSILLSAEPEMPQDEVLARLLFGQSLSRLSALQLTRLGLAAGAFAGIGGQGPGLLERVRAGLGLARFDIDSDARRPDDVALEGGRYLNERVYLGGRQGARTGEAQGVLRMEVSPQLRLETDVGASGARAGAAFELEY
ncbi:hypothetical protein F2Q65_04760 [Thiohalocapsa marina]|uniref:Translocation and assembly module TamB C-terminal domain-containing protein n=1 Tax=Thiohalocapsa marina TaxID=424902 RepID=A0A5M8FP38_9GAMM|nr:translocation/assembly module TamB domain-containing protein [Thiohalocapsa marina]KAA6186683.1 hypothetical protein F2Q65_04760 [Thiohalocapsa marina]